MEVIKVVIDFILHIKDHLSDIITNYPEWFYAVIFLVIFAETGLVVTPFLPGDSLLFAIGALAAIPQNNLNPWLIFLILLVAAVLGDTVNYHTGKSEMAMIAMSTTSKFFSTKGRPPKR